jgi:hypothetical protein
MTGVRECYTCQRVKQVRTYRIPDAPHDLDICAACMKKMVEMGIDEHEWEVRMWKVRILRGEREEVTI